MGCIHWSAIGNDDGPDAPYEREAQPHLVQRLSVDDRRRLLGCGLQQADDILNAGQVADRQWVMACLLAGDDGSQGSLNLPAQQQ